MARIEDSGRLFNDQVRGHQSPESIKGNQKPFQSGVINTKMLKEYLNKLLQNVWDEHIDPMAYTLSPALESYYLRAIESKIKTLDDKTTISALNEIVQGIKACNKQGEELEEVRLKVTKATEKQPPDDNEIEELENQRAALENQLKELITNVGDKIDALKLE